MTEYALVSPEGIADRIQPASHINPDVATKPGWCWLSVRREYGEPFEGVEGNEYVVRTVDPATLPPPVPLAISDRQFAHALKNSGVITHAEAMAFVQTGTIPAALQSIVDQIEDQDAREAAELLLAGATIFERGHQMTEALRTGIGWTTEQADDLWREGATL